jgi:alpha-beta hydrolase superfamily lysophospholipase
MRRTYRYCAATTAAAIAVAIGGCAALEMKERELLFRPIKEAAGWYNGTPATVQEIWLPVGDGTPAERIHAWWWPAEHSGAPVVLYLHGVRWNLTGHLNRMSQLRRFGFSVFAIDYRGFGESDGELPSEATVYEDARAGWKWVVEREPDASRRYIYGHSLGGAVAVDLAANVSNTAASARGLIVESSFTSLPELLSLSGYGWLPIPISEKFDSVAKIPKISMPVLIVHGEDDRYVPAQLSSALYAAAPQPKKLLLIPNASHNNSVWTGDADYRLALKELFGPVQAERGASGTIPVASQRAHAGPNVNR